MIFGRPTNLIIGAFTALFNVAVLISSQLGYPITEGLVAAVNLAAAALITLIAFQPPTVNVGDTYHVINGSGQAEKKIA